MLSALGVIGSSAMENEHRLPLHPDHIPALDADLRVRITLEHGYGAKFGVADAALSEHVAGFASREEILAESSVVLLPKPQLSDLAAMGDGQVLWGWPHCVQDAEITQVAIDQGLTLIAFEVMNYWTNEGSFGRHVFHMNNELAGYCSVIHSLALAGITGDYGWPLRAVVIGSGATARGAVNGLKAHGVDDVVVLTNRNAPITGPPINGARAGEFVVDSDGGQRGHVITDRGQEGLASYLTQRDIVVNCTLQDPSKPLMYLDESDLEGFRPGSLIVDVSCNLAMGFSWARPTTFEEPAFVVGDNILYYGVDHSPSYLWNTSTWENSNALIPFLRTVMEGGSAWDGNETIRRAIEIRDGHVVNPHILAFQGRASDAPFDVIR